MEYVRITVRAIDKNLSDILIKGIKSNIEKGGKTEKKILKLQGYNWHRGTENYNISKQLPVYMVTSQSHFANNPDEKASLFNTFINKQGVDKIFYKPLKNNDFELIFKMKFK